VKEGHFKVYAVATVDEAVASLTGMPGGERCRSTGKNRWYQETLDRRTESSVAFPQKTGRLFVVRFCFFEKQNFSVDSPFPLMLYCVTFDIRSS